MLTPIRCFTCAYPLGDIADIFRTLKREKIIKVAEENDIAVNKLFISEVEINMEKELDELNITSECCRMHMLTTVYFSDVYN